MASMLSEAVSFAEDGELSASELERSLQILTDTHKIVPRIVLRGRHIRSFCFPDILVEMTGPPVAKDSTSFDRGPSVNPAAWLPGAASTFLSATLQMFWGHRWERQFGRATAEARKDASTKLKVTVPVRDHLLPIALAYTASEDLSLIHI